MGASSGRAPQLLAVLVFGGIGLALYWSQNRDTGNARSNQAAAPASNQPAVTSPATVPSTGPVIAAPSILSRWISLSSAPSPHQSRTDRAVQQAAAKVKGFPGQPEGYTELTVAFMQKARETADAAYYSRAEAACGKALQIDPDYYDAVRLVPWIYVNQHRFTEAVTTARRAIAIKPLDAWNFGTLGDALAELGDYDESARAIDQMVSLRPDNASYARVAHQRELRGDTTGAVQTMSMAAESAATGAPENAAWCRVQLGNILFNAGRLSEAADNYSKALELYPDYYFALAGMGRVKGALGESDAAIALFRRSLAIAPRHETVVWLGDLLLHLNRPVDAAREFELLEAIDKILRANGVQPGTQMALFYADHDQQIPKAVELAVQCAAERHDVRTQDALAWALYKAGRYDDAATAIQKALRLGTRDASFLFHAGMIESKRGHVPEALAPLQRALEINPYFDIRHAEEARAVLKGLVDGQRASPSLGTPGEGRGEGSAQPARVVNGIPLCAEPSP